MEYVRIHTVQAAGGFRIVDFALVPELSFSTDCARGC